MRALRPVARRRHGRRAVACLLRAARERIELAGLVLEARCEAIGVFGYLARVDAIDGGFAPGIVRARDLFVAAVGSDPALTSFAVGRPFEERNVAASAVAGGGVITRISRVGVAFRIRATAARLRAGLAARRWRRATHEGAVAVGRCVSPRCRCVFLRFRRVVFGGRRTTPDQRDDHDGDGREGRDDASKEGAHDDHTSNLMATPGHPKEPRTKHYA